MKLVFMGTPAFALPTLEALHGSDHSVVAVYTQPPRPAGRGQKDTPSPVYAYAAEHKLPLFTPVSLKTPEAQAEFATLDADIAVVVAYGLLLPKPILEAYRLGCINVHPSLLPRWRGAAPIQRAIMAGDKMTGITIMQMDEGLDTGDIVLQEKEFLVDAFDAGTLHDMLAEEAGPLVLLALEGLHTGSITPVKQSQEGVTYAKKITKEECRIDWTQPAEHIHRQIQGLSPSPGAYFLYKGETIKVLSSSFSTMKHFNTAIPGTVLDKHLVVTCGQGILNIEEVQRPGKSRMFASEMLKGFPIPPGSILS
jgi:methionyl-tRNA formyltransferase